jgi:DNA replication protein DnaC
MLGIREPARLEDLDTRFSRNLDSVLISTVRHLGRIGRHLNALITGPTGIGKSFVGAALSLGVSRRLQRTLHPYAAFHR